MLSKMRSSKQCEIFACLSKCPCSYTARDVGKRSTLEWQPSSLPVADCTVKSFFTFHTSMTNLPFSTSQGLYPSQGVRGPLHTQRLHYCTETRQVPFSKQKSDIKTQGSAAESFTQHLQTQQILTFNIISSILTISSSLQAPSVT